MKFYKVIVFVLICVCELLCESLVFPPYLHSYGIRKATSKSLFLFFGNETRFDDPQGICTTRLNSWDNPKTKKDDDEVVVYGVNSGRNEIIYNHSMYKLALYGNKGSGDGCFNSPKGIIANSYGDVYVADSGNNRVVHLYNPKANLIWVSAFSGKTFTDPGLLGPLRVAIDEDGLIYVTDAVNKKITVFNKNETVKKYIPEKKNDLMFDDNPTALVVADGTARSSYFKNERVIFCADENGTRLWKLDLNGNILAQASVKEGYHAFYGATDFYHNYWITDKKNHCILKYDHNLKFLDIFGSYGEKDNQFVEPRGIAIYKRFGQVFVAEKKGAQYYWIGTQLNSMTLKDYSNGKYRLTVNSTEYSFVSLFSLFGKDTVYFCKRKMIFPGNDFFIIDNSSINCADRSIKLKIEPTYSSYTFKSWVYPISVSK